MFGAPAHHAYPSWRTRFSEVWLGALAATGLIWLGERLFLVYAANFANFNVLYGALGGIVAFLLWLYLSGCVGVFGVCFCAAQAEVRGRTNDPTRTSQ
jgi:YihY family inner membrane protein